ncbi:MAG TPA: hypothetical protein VES79_14370 [Solirubrobacteraceae bacterium]|nr:hypothetical protein [Solirubrobacteraceae bacterium]
MSSESPQPDTEPTSTDIAPGEGPVSGEFALAEGDASAPVTPAEPAPPVEPVTTEHAPTAEPQTATEHAPTAKQRPQQQRRRRRPSAADRHRRAFYARLTEVRKQGDSPSPHAEAGEGEAAQPAEAGTEAPVEAPAAEATAAEESAPGVAEQPAQAGDPKAGRSQARLVAAVERVGGSDVVRDALSPQRREDGQNQKWSAVCCDRAVGLKPGDPVFQAWVRLASTPVRDVKSVAVPPREDRQRRGGRHNDERGRDRQDRPSRGSASGGDVAALGRDGSFRPTVRIIGLEDAEASKREREESRRAERDAKRQAEAERLARLGY